MHIYERAFVNVVVLGSRYPAYIFLYCLSVRIRTRIRIRIRIHMYSNVGFNNACNSTVESGWDWVQNEEEIHNAYNAKNKTDAMQQATRMKCNKQQATRMKWDWDWMENCAHIEVLHRVNLFFFLLKFSNPEILTNTHSIVFQMQSQISILLQSQISKLDKLYTNPTKYYAEVTMRTLLNLWSFLKHSETLKTFWNEQTLKLSTCWYFQAP